MESSKSKLEAIQLALLLSLTLCGYPAVASLSTILGFDNRLASIAVRLFIILLCVALITRMRFVDPRNARIGVWAPFVLFWVLYVLRIIWDGYLTSAHLARESYLYLVFAVGCVAPMLAIMLSGGLDRTTSEKSRRFCLAMLTLVSLSVLWAFQVSTNFQIGMPIDNSRMMLDVLNPIATGHLGGSLVILAVFSLLETRASKKYGLRKTTYPAALIIGAILLVASASRGPMLATALALAVYGVSRLGQKKGWVNFLIVAFVFVGGAWLAAAVEAKMGFSALSRMLGLIRLGGGDATASLRLTMIDAAWDQFLSSPFLGSGLEERISRFYPHNVIVEAFMAIGIVGGVAFVVILVMAFLAAWKILIRRTASGWIAMLAIQYMAAAQFSGALWSSSAMWTLIGAVIAAAYFNRRDELWASVQSQ